MHPSRTTRRGLIAAAMGMIATTAFAVIVSGKTWGQWDLPNGGVTGSAGYALGALADGTGATVFKMKAKLAETPSPSLSTRVGTMSGELDDGVAGYPIYTVSGNWKAAALTGVGTFSAGIYRQVSPLGPIALIGKMAGNFKDNPWFIGPGKYEGEWKADL